LLVLDQVEQPLSFLLGKQEFDLDRQIAGQLEEMLLVQNAMAAEAGDGADELRCRATNELALEARRAEKLGKRRRAQAQPGQRVAREHWFEAFAHGAVVGVEPGDLVGAQQ